MEERDKKRETERQEERETGAEGNLAWELTWLSWLSAHTYICTGILFHCRPEEVSNQLQLLPRVSQWGMSVWQLSLSLY